MNDTWFVYYSGERLDGEYGYEEKIFVFSRPDNAWIKFVSLKDILWKFAQFNAANPSDLFYYDVQALQVYIGSTMALWMGKAVTE